VPLEKLERAEFYKISEVLNNLGANELKKLEGRGDNYKRRYLN